MSSTSVHSHSTSHSCRSFHTCVLLLQVLRIVARPPFTVVQPSQHHCHSFRSTPARVIGTGTFGCGSTIVEGEDFIAENITFENSSPEAQTIFLGWQDTLYLHYGKQYLKDCYIEGSVDFIFGNSTALLEHCHIHSKSAGFITAQSRKSSQESTGYVFLRCFGPGCCPSKRVNWYRELVDEEAEHFVMHPFIDPEPDRPWLSQRMGLRVPYSA